MFMKTIAAAAALMVSVALPSYAEAADTSILRICTGGKSGNYYFAGQEIASRLGNSLFKQVVLVNTAGSLDNLRRLSNGECDLAFAQDDVTNQFVIENPAKRDTMSVFHIAYTEYTHLLCPVVTGWDKLSKLADAKGKRKLIVGPDGSGTAETWRILRAANPDKYDAIERIADPADYSSAHTVAISKDTCMLWVSGLNSNDMVSTNALSVKTPKGTPSLILASMNDDAMLKIKANDGTALYASKDVSPIAPKPGVAGMYENLIPNTAWVGTSSIMMLAIPANIMISTEYKKALDRGVLARIQTAIDDAQPTIWGRVDPAGH